MSTRTSPSLESAVSASTLSRKASALDLSKCFGTAEDSDHTDQASHGERLEQVPAGIVHKEDKLHGNDRPKEGNVRQWSRTNGLGEVVEVCAQCQPLHQVSNMRRLGRPTETYANEKSGNRSNHGQREEQRNHFRRALGVGAENVVDLGLLAIPHCLLVLWRGGIGVCLDLDIEYLAVIRMSRSERTDHD